MGSINEIVVVKSNACMTISCLTDRNRSNINSYRFLKGFRSSQRILNYENILKEQ